MNVVQEKGPGFRFILFLASIALIGAAGWTLWPLPQTQALRQRIETIASTELPSWIRSVELPSWIHARAEDRSAVHQSRSQHKGAISRDNGEIPVIAVTARAGDIPIDLNALGTVAALATVTVKSQLGGYLTEVAFTEGQMVKRGDFLAQIDPRPYQIALDQAQGQLARDQAQLGNAKSDYGRYKKLSSQDSISRQQVDSQQSLVQQYSGTIVADQAQIESAKLNLDYCHITAPITGRIGLRQVDPGNYVQSGGATSLAVITQLQPISVVFTIPEDDIPMVQRRLQEGADLPVTIFDRSHSTKLATGTLTTIDNEIDTGTGTVKLRAQFDNADQALFPNQFVNVTLQVDIQHDDVVVPMAAVQHGPAGPFVYLVKPDGSAGQQPVQTGPSSGDDVAILSGLAPDDEVVVDGVDQLRDGSKVVITKRVGESSSEPIAVTRTDTQSSTVSQ
jgi:membrane fusion protein, multidrug efflux system